jgi:hypothetical protein
MCVTFSAHLTPPWLDHSNYVWRRVQVMKLLNVQFFQPPITSLLFGPYILLSILLSNTFSLCSSLNVREQVPHPYRTTGHIVVLCILIFTFINSRHEDKLFWTRKYLNVKEMKFVCVLPPVRVTDEFTASQPTIYQSVMWQATRWTRVVQIPAGTLRFLTSPPLWGLHGTTNRWLFPRLERSEHEAHTYV